MKLEDVLKRLETDCDKGLTPEEAPARKGP
jgi:hypothetical protein